MKKKLVSLLLIVCFLVSLSTTALAAGEGYSDIIRIYTISGLDGKTM